MVLQGGESSIVRTLSHLKVAEVTPFKGRVFVLIGKRSTSAAMGCAAAVHHYGLGVLVGEETADCFQFFGEGQRFTLPLPLYTCEPVLTEAAHFLDGPLPVRRAGVFLSRIGNSMDGTRVWILVGMTTGGLACLGQAPDRGPAEQHLTSLLWVINTPIAMLVQKVNARLHLKLEVPTLWLVFLLCPMLFSGCSTPPKLTAEDRRRDIEYLAAWARDYSPLVVLNEARKDVPSYETLKPKYLEFAGTAENHAQFYQVVSGYFKVIGASGHAYLFDEKLLKWSAIGNALGIGNWGISSRRLWKATYWARLTQKISTRVHPPFSIVAREGAYFTTKDWEHNGSRVPGGSEIISVNGMSCSSYLKFVKTRTPLRYDAYPKDWVDTYLLVIDEGGGFQGWLVKFRLPDSRLTEARVPKVEGFPVAKESVASTDARENCTCIELTETVGYIRIKNMWHGPLSYVFKGPMKQERKRIRRFLQHSQGKYRKLIIDIRNNGGGLPAYVYDNLVCPFLDGPVTVRQVAGVRRKYLRDTKPAALRELKRLCGRFVTETREIPPPDDFAPEDWVFYEITREIRPSERYLFDGDLYVLINGGSWSAADDYADLVKRTGLGTLVGQNTGGGGGAYLLPAAVRLPGSGMIFRLETEILLTPDGGINELSGTAPDLRLPYHNMPRSITRADLLQDPWVEQVIANEVR